MTQSLTFLAQLEKVANTSPTAIAVADETEVVSYEALWERVKDGASRLRESGLQPGGRVALVAENSAAFLSAAFAVWAADGVLVTVYPSTAIGDLATTLRDCDPVLVLADRDIRASVEAAAADLAPVAPVELLRESIPAVRAATVPNPDGLREPVHLICYSSGTTSRPKAIMISESALASGARTYADVWHLGSDDKTIVCLPMAWLFGLATTSMATLVAGGTVLALRRSRPELLLQALTRDGGTFLAGVTTMFAKLVHHIEALPQPVKLPNLRLCISGGEPRNEAAFARFNAVAGCPVLDNYCASECFPLVTYDPFVSPEVVPGSAGKVVARSELKVVDPEGNVVAPGTPGEAFSRGPGLMLGYWNDPEQTAASLTDDGWYRTKDLVRIDDEGFVYVVGRLSDMIIRGGSNISPAEVEEVLRRHPSVADVSVVGPPDPLYGQEVVAVVVPASSNSLEEEELRRFAQVHLAAFKLPTRIVVRDELPQNSTTGKVDRRRLLADLERLDRA